MAKKKTTKKKPAAKKPSAKKSASTKKPAASKKKSASTAASKKTAKKAAAKKSASKKPAPKKKAPAKKAASDKPKAASGKSSKKTSKAASEKKPAAPAKKPSTKKSAKPEPSQERARGSVKPPKKTKAEMKAEAKSEAETFAEAKAAAARLAALAGLRPIESRPFESDAGAGEEKRLTKSPLTKKELQKYRQLLIEKRAEILGDVESMEGEALMSGERMSHTPNHAAEQGSDISSQSLSLDIAATQRKLLGEIDAALKRIEDGTFGICTMMGTAIGKARLDAKPWASLCIEAARRLERGAYAS
ncbi:MAG: TraR/DksA family transcriptional regulator [Phycisphaerales bacterium]